MPIVSRVSSGRRKAVQASPQGGYTVVGIPDPNDPMEALKRANPDLQYGTRGPSQFPITGQGGTNPTIAGSGESALSRNVNLEQRGRAEREAYEQEYARANPFAPIRTVTPMIGVDALLQALSESGADRVRSGAASKMGAPGFFDTQQSRMARPMSAREQMLLQEMLKQSATGKYAQIER